MKLTTSLPIILLFAAPKFINIQGDDDFVIYWNIPTFMCRKHGIFFYNLTHHYGIIQNQNDDFRGNQIAILYDPGKFPAILQNTSSNEFFYRNGGVPQEGNLLEHLQLLQTHVQELIPDPLFKGIGIIDFESWRPIFRQNFGTLQAYKDMSINLLRYRHPFWTDKRIHREASKIFETAGREFMDRTLTMAQQLRPHATWGYYAYPYCFNIKIETRGTCPALRWLFDAVDGIFPSVYLSEQIPKKHRAAMVAGRVEEALRFARLQPTVYRPKVFVYHRYLYTDSLKYVSEADTIISLRAVKDTGADGVILWGSSYDLDTKHKCKKFHEYLTNTLGPAALSLRQEYFVQPLVQSSYYYYPYNT